MSLTLAQDIKIRDAYADGGLEAVIAYVGSLDFQEKTLEEGYQMALAGVENMLAEMKQDFPF